MRGAGKSFAAAFRSRYNGHMNKPAFLSRTVKVTRIGNSAGIILPKEVLARLRAQIGDIVSMNIDDDGGITLTAVDSEFEEEMRLAREIMEKRRSALRELAK